MRAAYRRSFTDLCKLIATLKAVITLLFLFLAYPCYTSADNAAGDIPRLIAAGLSRSELQVQDCNAMFHLQDERFQCGYLSVPENYSRTSGRTIKVPYLVIYPDAQVFDSSLTPLLVTGGGGPGNAILATRQYAIAEDEFWSYEQFSVADGRALIVLENRGVGLSEPELDCHYPAAIFTGNIWQKMHERNTACGQFYEEKEVDLSQYNVHTAALDIEVFRRLYKRSGVDMKQLNLYGISYGTHVAMHYERLFPAATRAMVLDSIAIKDQDSAEDELNHAQRSFDLVFEQCRLNPDCSRQFGFDLETEFYDYLKKIENRDMSLPVKWPDNQKSIAVPITAPLVVSVIHDALYSGHTIAAIPLTISNLMNGKSDRFRAMLAEHLYTYSQRYGFSDMAFLTYLCFDENYSVNNHNKLKHLKLFKYWELATSKEYMRQICAAYGITPNPALRAPQPARHDPISDTPTLFLSGKLDPVTPPSSASKAARHFSNHWNIVRETISHDVITYSSCARTLASWFIYHPYEDLELIESGYCNARDYAVDFLLK